MDLNYDYPDFERACGDCICKVCNKSYYGHPYAEEYKSWIGIPWLRRLCDGRLVKL